MVYEEDVHKNELDEIVFKVGGEQYQKLIKWQQEIDTRVAKQQLETGRGTAGQPLSPLKLEVMVKSFEIGEARPHYGPLGGAYVFSFSSNNLGMVITVKNIVTGDEIDLTDYENW